MNISTVRGGACHPVEERLSIWRSCVFQHPPDEAVASLNRIPFTVYFVFLCVKPSFKNFTHDPPFQPQRSVHVPLVSFIFIHVLFPAVYILSLSYPCNIVLQTSLQHFIVSVVIVLIRALFSFEFDGPWLMVLFSRR